MSTVKIVLLDTILNSENILAVIRISESPGMLLIADFGPSHNVTFLLHLYRARGYY